MIINITGFGYSYHGMNQNIALVFSGSSNSQLSMGSMHWISSLKGNHSIPTPLIKFFSKLSWSESNFFVVIVSW